MNDRERSRYARQIRLNKIGEDGQQKLLDSSVLVVGMGGLGSPVAMYLAASGVGRMIISDYDQIEESNLQRQVIHKTKDIGELKAFSAKQTISEINPDCDVEALDWQLDEDELVSYAEKVDLILDCTDNFPTRFMINRVSVKTGTPLISGAAIRMEGQVASYFPDSDNPCYQCLYKEQYENTETCAMEGVLSPIVGVIGTMQALQAVLALIGEIQSTKGKLMLFDGLNMEWQSLRIPKNPDCPVCSAL